MKKIKHKKMNTNILSVPGVFPVCSRSNRNLLAFSIGKKRACSRCVPGFDRFLKIEILPYQNNCEKLAETAKGRKESQFWKNSQGAQLKKCQNREQPGTENGLFDQPPGTLNTLVLWSLDQKNAPVPGVPGQNMTSVFFMFFLSAFYWKCENFNLIRAIHSHFKP